MEENLQKGLECLDEDVMGELLPRLDDADIQNALLCCKGWRTAIRRQTRELRPVYIPLVVPDVYNSLEQLQLPLVRPAPAVARITAAMPAPLTSLAPLGCIEGFKNLFHAAHVDLSGQKLPNYTLKLLSLHMQRLRTLVLDSCVLAPAVLLYATGLTRLQHLSLSGVQFLKWRLPLPPCQKQLADQDATAADDGDVPMSFKCLTAVAEAAIRESHVSVAESNRYKIEHQPWMQLLADAWVPRQQQHQQQLQKLLTEQHAGMVFFEVFSLGHMPLNTQERSILLDAVLLPQLQTLNMDLKPPAFFRVNQTPNMASNACVGFEVSGHLSKLTRLSCLSSLSLAGNGFDADDWNVLCSALSGKLTKLHIHWDGADDSLDATAFAQLGTFCKLQSLGLSFTNMSNQSMFAEYSLAPLGRTLTSLRLECGYWCNANLLMSITRCSKVARLELSGLREPFRDEHLVQVVRSMPLLQSLTVSKLHPVARHDYIVCQPGDTLLSQLGTCCPMLTELLIPDVPADGRGLKSAGAGLPGTQQGPHSGPTVSSVWTADTSTADGRSAGAVIDDAAATPAAVSVRGGLHSLQQLELCATQVMRATLQHLSQLTNLRSLTLYGMPLREFPHACRLNCFAPLSALKHLTSLRMLPIPAEQARFAQLPPYVPGQMGATAAVPQQLQQQAQHMIQLAVNAVDVHQQQLQQWGEELGHQGVLPEGDDDVDAGAVQHMAQNLLQAIQHIQQMNDLLQAGMPGAAAALDAAAAAAIAAGAGGGGAAAAAEGNHHVMPPVLHHVWDPHVGDNAAGAAADNAAGMQVGWNGMILNNIDNEGDSSDGEHEWESGSEGDWEEGEISDEDHLEDEQQQQQQGPQPGVDVDNEMDVDEPQQPPPQQQQQQAPLQPWNNRLSFEPHLHFLSGLPGLVALELGCLQTSGICLLHLHSLPQLRSLTLGGNITLAESSWQSLSQLQLPGVTQLSLTGCRFVNLKIDSSATTAAAVDRSSSGGAGSSRAAAAAAAVTAAVDNIISNVSNMDRLAALLVRSCPGVIRCEIGSCGSLSYDGLECLILGWQKLKMLRLLGVKNLQLADKLAELHAQVTAAATAAAAASKKASGPGSLSAANAVLNPGNSKHESLQHQLQQQQQQRRGEPYLNQIQQRYRHQLGPTARLQLKYLEVCEGQLPQSGFSAALVTAAHSVGHFAAQQGRRLVFVMQEGKMVQVQQ